MLTRVALAAAAAVAATIANQSVVQFPVVQPPVVVHVPISPVPPVAQMVQAQLPALLAMLFSLTPYGCVLDFANTADTKLYSSVSSTFASAFDGTAIGLIGFTDQVHTGVISIACRDIFSVQVGTDVYGHALFHDVLTKWSSITPVQVKASADICWSINDWRKQSSFILGNVILESTTPELRNRLFNIARSTPWKVSFLMRRSS